VTALLEARGLGKKYRHGGGEWALRDLDLHVEDGEVVAVIGRNGAGKSTLLKVVSGVTSPSAGTLVRAERVAPLIEVGAGFDLELSGRENVAVNARLLGMTRREIRQRFDDIVAFSELEHVIDRRVSEYSSGMFMRLGFAVAVHTDPELLLVDEVLAVGDLPFQVKCLDRIREMRAAGVGVLFVSHNLAAVLGLATRAVLLEKGRPVTLGEPQQVVGAYHALLGTAAESGLPSDDVAPVGELELVSLSVTNTDGDEPLLWQPGQRVRLALRLRATKDIGQGLVGIRLSREGAGLVAAWMALEGPYTPALAAGETTDFNVEFDLNVAEGAYHLDLAVGRRDMTAMQYSQQRLYRFGVANRAGGSGLVDIAPALDVGSGVS
jgi:ABC-type polysaccharide/polyol phosphate transport system ATPase subunit